MQATADSSTERVREIGTDSKFWMILKLERAFPNRVISK